MISSRLALRLWLLTALCFGIGGFAWYIFSDREFAFMLLFIGSLAALIGSVPALIILLVCIPLVKKRPITTSSKIELLLALQFFIATGYGILAGISSFTLDFFSGTQSGFFETTAIAVAALFSCSFCAAALSYKKITAHFSENNIEHFQTNTYMESNYTAAPANYPGTNPQQSNKTLIKGIVTGILILVLLIPTYFISGLVTERQARKEKIVEEAGNGWAGNQVLSGPYLYIPFKNGAQHITLLPEQLNVKGNVFPEDRQRSIYKVLLYKSTVTGTGLFDFRLPKTTDINDLQLADAKICFGISDFKGIEDRVLVHFNNTDYELSPGLPAADIDSRGLSAPVSLAESDLQQNIAFNYSVKIKGSGRLHFIPAAGNSSFTLQSSWSNPSFDGYTIPTEHSVTDTGFTARWVFNKASLPFTTVLQNNKTIEDKSDFGVSILQPVDDYAKTTRCIKYAIMFIGLTFALFFIVEILQKKPVHLVQYVLVGLALVIFYSLLLSVSELIHFDWAYGIAATATVLLISLYAKSHFKNWKTASLFAGVLAGLYAFNYVLVSLEDTALLAGSIALFIVLAIAMYASRKVNWYGTDVPVSAETTA